MSESCVNLLTLPGSVRDDRVYWQFDILERIAGRFGPFRCKYTDRSGTVLEVFVDALREADLDPQTIGCIATVIARGYINEYIDVDDDALWAILRDDVESPEPTYSIDASKLEWLDFITKRFMDHEREDEMISREEDAPKWPNWLGAAISDARAIATEDWDSSILLADVIELLGEPCSYPEPEYEQERRERLQSLLCDPAY